MMLLDSLEECVGMSDVKPSSLLTSKGTSSSRMLNAFAASSRLVLVKYQRGTSLSFLLSPLLISSHLLQWHLDLTDLAIVASPQCFVPPRLWLRWQPLDCGVNLGNKLDSKRLHHLPSGQCVLMWSDDHLVSHSNLSLSIQLICHQNFYCTWSWVLLCLGSILVHTLHTWYVVPLDCCWIMRVMWLQILCQI